MPRTRENRFNENILVERRVLSSFKMIAKKESFDLIGGEGLILDIELGIFRILWAMATRALQHGFRSGDQIQGLPRFAMQIDRTSHGCIRRLPHPVIFETNHPSSSRIFKA